VKSTPLQFWGNASVLHPASQAKVFLLFFTTQSTNICLKQGPKIAALSDYFTVTYLSTKNQQIVHKR
jgi:hypothetical protein